MNKMLSKEEMQDFWLTRQEKLKRLAKVVRQYKFPNLNVRELELASIDDLKRQEPAHHTVLYIAAHDFVLNDAGLKNHGSLYDVIQFLELSHTDLELICSGSGYISNDVMADRLEKLAG